MGTLHELTILMPCLNEEETVGICVDKAKQFIESNGLDGEVLVADNGSVDGSRDIAAQHGARVVFAPRRGYGAALQTGITAACSKYIIMGDADASYDFSSLSMFVDRLRKGDELVMGNRFQGGIEKGAMPYLHRYLGNPVLSWIGRVFFNVHVGDFHSGLRGFNKASIMRLGLRTQGMEFASEMVVKSALHNLRISEVPITLYPDGRSHPPHLRTWSDGWRHLKFLLLYCPRWLFFYPGISIFLLGLTGILLSLLAPHTVNFLIPASHSIYVSTLLALAGSQTVSFAVLLNYYANNSNLWPDQKNFPRFIYHANLDHIMESGSILSTLGFLGWIFMVLGSAGVIELADETQDVYQWLAVAAFFLLLGLQIVFLTFSVELLKKKIPIL